MISEREAAIETDDFERFKKASRHLDIHSLLKESEYTGSEAVLTEEGLPAQTHTGNYFPFALHYAKIDGLWGWYGQIHNTIVRRSMRYLGRNKVIESDMCDSPHDALLWITFELKQIKREKKFRP